MEKRCDCGAVMSIRVRNVIFSNKVSIENVPVYSCEHCERNEVLPDVKQQLTDMIHQLGGRPEKQTIPFHESNELAFLIHEATKKERCGASLDEIVRDRVNQLLDLMLLARSLNDAIWNAELRSRLSQIAQGSASTYK